MPAPAAAPLSVAQAIFLALFAGSSINAANQAARARREATANQQAALQQQQEQAVRLNEKLAEQSAMFGRSAGALEEQSRIAREQLKTAQDAYSQNVKEFETGLTQYQQSRLEMAQKAAETQKQIDDERRRAAEQQATQLRARQRGGRRMLLSQERESPELGVLAQALGSGMRIS